MRLSRLALLFALAAPLLSSAEDGHHEPLPSVALKREPGLVGQTPAPTVVALPASDFIQKVEPSAQLQKGVPVPGESSAPEGYIAYSFHKFDSGEWALGLAALLGGLGAFLRMYGTRLHPWFSTGTGVAVTSAGSSVVLMVLHSLAASASITWLTVAKAVLFALVSVVPGVLLWKPVPAVSDASVPGGGDA